MQGPNHTVSSHSGRLLKLSPCAMHWPGNFDSSNSGNEVPQGLQQNPPGSDKQASEQAASSLAPYNTHLNLCRAPCTSRKRLPPHQATEEAFKAILGWGKLHELLSPPRSYLKPALRHLRTAEKEALLGFPNLNPDFPLGLTSASENSFLGLKHPLHGADLRAPQIQDLPKASAQDLSNLTRKISTTLSI